MPVCIAGMHRSGTSMLAKLLHLCGLSLGRPGDLMDPAPDNPDGFWENRRFVAVNDELLEENGGAWDRPPAGRIEWTTGRSRRLRDETEGIVGELADVEPWGWKDPRNSLTLPFWLELVPDLKVVVAVRNPLEVAASLRRRNTMSMDDAMRLWLVYNTRILEDSTRERRLITRFAEYFVDSEHALRSVLGFLGLNPPKQVVLDAHVAVDVAMRHARFSAEDLGRSEVPARVVELYQEMCGEAGAERQRGERACAG